MKLLLIECPVQTCLALCVLNGDPEGEGPLAPHRKLKRGGFKKTEFDGPLSFTDGSPTVNALRSLAATNLADASLLQANEGNWERINDYLATVDDASQLVSDLGWKEEAELAG